MGGANGQLFLWSIDRCMHFEKEGIAKGYMCADGLSFCAADNGKAPAITAWKLCWKWEG